MYIIVAIGAVNEPITGLKKNLDAYFQQKELETAKMIQILNMISSTLPTTRGIKRNELQIHETVFQKMKGCVHGKQ